MRWRWFERQSLVWKSKKRITKLRMQTITIKKNTGRGLKTVSLCLKLVCVSIRQTHMFFVFGHFGFAEMSNLRGFRETSLHSPHFKVERRLDDVIALYVTSATPRPGRGSFEALTVQGCWLEIYFADFRVHGHIWPSTWKKRGMTMTTERRKNRW